jgi:hypothetical protein
MEQKPSATQKPNFSSFLPQKTGCKKSQSRCQINCSILQNFGRNRQSFLFRLKMPKKLEGQPKKQAFASHGDFRGYLYEAPIFPMPT